MRVNKRVNDNGVNDIRVGIAVDVGVEIRVDIGTGSLRANGGMSAGTRVRHGALALLLAVAGAGPVTGAIAQPIGGMAPEPVNAQSLGHANAAAQGGEVGETTRMLLAVQRNGTQAGQMLRVPGEQAALAYQRYLDSFRHPIPERFVGQTSGAGIVGARAAINGTP